jgi:hypothetical protein
MAPKVVEIGLNTGWKNTLMQPCRVVDRNDIIRQAPFTSIIKAQRYFFH